MGVIYDSTWVPAASGVIQASLVLEGFHQARIIFAASGTNGLSSVLFGWQAGADGVIPPAPKPIGSFGSSPYPVLPKVTGTVGVSAPGANANTAVIINPDTSASYIPFIPDQIYLTATQGSASWGRIIVEGVE